MRKLSKHDQSKKFKLNSMKNYEWFIKKADASKYAGMWIAVENKKIVMSDTHLDRVLEEVKENWPNASITKIPKRGQIMVL